ncbi:MAG TPA: sulfite exporter TauE/SafE family protein, partial [Pyrinomonadaceae bacterium]|nr:sulfite exporter TauE/SafE family protein [Pyrinomonadaceae bacterium]
IAAGLGALHALSPGHGKTVVGAYLVGSRGTARHAAFLGLTVTITHTLGVFALGLVTLFASAYVVPERLFPILSFISGAIVLGLGLTLFVRRLRSGLKLSTVAHDHHSHAGHYHSHHEAHQAHTHEHPDHTHDTPGEGRHEGSAVTHSHGGREHTHLPPGADGSRVAWRSLLALGISGGLLPCPSALVVLLSAISLHRTGYGLLLVIAFSFGLACTLTGIGLVFVFARRFMERRLTAVATSRAARLLPAFSAFVISCVGAVICYEALVNAGFNLSAFFTAGAGQEANPVSTASVLALGLVFGLKHAVEADHLAAVSTIVSERKSILSSTLVGGLWGIGHTISLVVAGVGVIMLHVRIGERMALALEFVVALMLIMLGANVIRKLARGDRLHFHTHRHGRHAHAHPHIHDRQAEESTVERRRFLAGARPLFIGMVHGLAGSAALMLLVLSTIPSPLVGMAYILVFGVGSIGGMMLMSALIGLPVRLMADRFRHAQTSVRGLAGLFSLGFGLFMVYQIGFVEGLFR